MSDVDRQFWLHGTLIGLRFFNSSCTYLFMEPATAWFVLAYSGLKHNCLPGIHGKLFYWLLPNLYKYLFKLKAVNKTCILYIVLAGYYFIIPAFG